jgi:hypothetical protein
MAGRPETIICSAAYSIGLVRIKTAPSPHLGQWTVYSFLGYYNWQRFRLVDHAIRFAVVVGSAATERQRDLLFLFHDDDGTAGLTSATKAAGRRASHFRHPPGISIILQDGNVPVQSPQTTTYFALDHFLDWSLSTQWDAKVNGAESLYRVDAAARRRRIAGGSTVQIQARRSRWW